MKDYYDNLMEFVIEEDSIKEYKERRILDESVISKSENGKKLQKEINSYVNQMTKEYLSKVKFAQRFANAARSDYNRQLLTKTMSFLKTKFNPFWNGSIITTTTYINGAMIKTCTCKI